MITFTEFISEGRSFELGGKKYSSGFGRYTCDGESISKEEYMKASTAYKNGKSVGATKNKTSIAYKNGTAKLDANEVEFKVSIDGVYKTKTGKVVTFSNLPGYKFGVHRTKLNAFEDFCTFTELSTGMRVDGAIIKNNSPTEKAVEKLVSDPNGHSFTHTILNTNDAKKTLDNIIANKMGKDFEPINQSLKPVGSEQKEYDEKESIRKTLSTKKIDKGTYELIDAILTHVDDKNRNMTSIAVDKFNNLPQSLETSSLAKVKNRYKFYKKKIKELQKAEKQIQNIKDMTDSGYSEREIFDLIGSTVDDTFENFMNIKKDCDELYAVLKKSA